MLKLLVVAGDQLGDTTTELTEEHFRPGTNRKMFVALRDAGFQVATLAGAEDQKMAAAVSALAVESLDGQPTAEYAQSVWCRLQEFVLKQQSDALRLRLQKLNPTTDDGYDALFRELVEVDGELRRLRQVLRDVM